MRDGIFVGYRLHTGGKWTEQYQIIDFEAYSQIQQGSGRLAYVHSVSEIYVPGSAGDDPEVHPTCPVAEGNLTEALASADEESTEELPSTVEDLQTDLGKPYCHRNVSVATKTLTTTRGALMVQKMMRQS